MIENQTELSQGKLKDLMLKYSFSGNGIPVSSTEISRELLTEINFDRIRFMLKEISETNPDIADIKMGEYETYIGANGLTQNFLDEGGFSISELIYKENLKKQSERENLELELAKSNLEANELNKKNAEQNKRNEKSNRIGMWINILIGIINLGLIVWQILTKK